MKKLEMNKMEFFIGGDNEAGADTDPRVVPCFFVLPLLSLSLTTGPLGFGYMLGQARRCWNS